MADLTEKLWSETQQAETSLQAYMKEKDATFPNILHFVSQYRFACENCILRDSEFAVGKDIENRLWDYHGRINNRFRKEFKYFQDTAGRKKPVERRKLVKDYLEFIKTAQRFYRGYIQRLASCFNGIPALEIVAKSMTMSTLSAESPIQAKGNLGRWVLLSCHQTLVRLGDLSRWRETQLETKNRNWGPAIGYYDLARAIYPSSGASHNQMAVIALVDLNHLNATYYLYRALAAEEPYPTARGNLELEFKKIQDAWAKGELIHRYPGHDKQAPGNALIGCFMRLHARCYSGLDFSEHDELESEVLSQLAVDLRERSLEHTLNRFVLINIAAAYFAGVRLQEDPNCAETLQSFFFFMRLNVKILFTLLRVLSPELERFVNDSGPASEHGKAKLTVVTRRLLPALRHYSSWLVTNATILACQIGDTSLHTQIKEMWKIYASTLTLLASTFPVTELPLIEYLLEEDEDTLCFRPFEHDDVKQRYYEEDTVTQKPKFHEQGVRRHHHSVEMYGRVRLLLTDGMLLHARQDIPIQLFGETFIYMEEGIPSDSGYEAAYSSPGVERNEIIYVNETASTRPAPSVDGASSHTTSMPVSMDIDSKRMVDDLVDSETADELLNTGAFDHNSAGIFPLDIMSSTRIGDETSYGMIGSATAIETFGDIQAPRPTSPRPLLPSIYNSAFAPEPGEEPPSSRPGTARHTTLGHSQHTSQTRFPFQQNLNLHSLESSTQGSVPDPTNASSHPQIQQTYRNPMFVNKIFSAPTNFTHGRKASSTYGHSTYDFNDTNFQSSELSWGGSGPIRKTSNILTPPNGQGEG